MAHTVFVDGSTVTANRIVAAWLNDADTVTYVRFGDGTSYTGNLTVPGTTSLTGTLTAAAINASGLVAMAGAATVGTTLGVTGMTTLGTTDGTLILTTKGYFNSRYAAATSLWQWGPGTISSGNAFGFTVGGTNVLDLLSGGIAVTGTLSVTGTSTMAAINASGDFNRTQSVDSVILVDCNNTANTSGASSRVRSIVGGSSASDPTFQWSVSGITSWFAGIDNSVSDQFIIGTDLPGGADWLKITTAGAVTIPGTLATLGSFSVNTTKFSVDATTGASSFGNTLAVGGTGLNNSAFAVNGTGKTYFATFSDFTSTTLTIAGSGGVITLTPTTSISVAGALGVTGATTLSAQTTFGERAYLNSTGRISVTGATTIYSTANGGASVGMSAALVLVNGYLVATPTNSFIDLVLFMPSGVPMVISSINRGVPAVRTYTSSGSNLQLAMASGTYNVTNSNIEQAC